jgi:hypothetical protein
VPYNMSSDTLYYYYFLLLLTKTKQHEKAPFYFNETTSFWRLWLI